MTQFIASDPEHKQVIITQWGLNQEYLEMNAEAALAYVTSHLSKLEQFTLCNCSADGEAIKQLHLACLFLHRGGQVEAGELRSERSSPATEAMTEFLATQSSAIVKEIWCSNLESYDFIVKAKGVLF